MLVRSEVVTRAQKSSQKSSTTDEADDCKRCNKYLMRLDVPHGRPLAKLAAHSAVQGGGARDWHVGPYAPPATLIDDGLDHVAADVRELCVVILRGVLLGVDLTTVRGRLAADLVTWSPQLFTVTRDQLLSSVHGAALSADQPE